MAKFEKSGALVTGDFLGKARIGDLAVDTTNGEIWSCTNATSAAWQQVGLQT